MTNYPYTDNVPNPPNNPSVDAPVMKVNTNSIDGIIGTDHVSFNNPNGGYHTLIHAISQGVANQTTGTYTPTSGLSQVEQIIALNVTPAATVTSTDSQLFAQSNGGILSQLTGGLVGTDGYTWAGGFLFQWGSVSFNSGLSHDTDTVTFKDRVPGAIAFPRNIFLVIPSLKIASSSTTTASNTISIRSISKTQFVYVFNSSSSSGTDLFPSFNWLAIGN